MRHKTTIIISTIITLFLVISCNNTNPFIGKWEVEKSHFNNKRGANEILIKESNDSLWFVYDTNKPPFLLKQGEDTLYFDYDEKYKIFFDTNDMLHVHFNRWKIVYHNSMSDNKTEKNDNKKFDPSGVWVSPKSKNYNRYLIITKDGENFTIHMYDQGNVVGGYRQEEHHFIGTYLDNQIDIGRDWPGPIRFSQDQSTIFFHSSKYKRRD